MNAPKMLVANDPEDRKGRLKELGGSESDHWNNILANQALQSLWLKNSSQEDRDKQSKAILAALAGIGPKDELEGMMAAQLVKPASAALAAMMSPASANTPATAPSPINERIPYMVESCKGNALR